MFKGDHKSLYDKMIKPPNLGYVTESREIGVNLIIGGSKLQQLLPPQVQLMSNQTSTFCGCQVYILSISLQGSINSLRLRHIIRTWKIAEYRSQTRLSGVFQERLSTYRECVYPFFHFLEYKSDASLSTLCPFIYFTLNF